jgi:hypothetical protein
VKRQFDPALPELMDRPQPVTRELERDLANLRSLNRWFGSHRLVRRFLRRWLRPNGTARILDVATGSGDIPRLIVDHAHRQNVSVHIDADRSAGIDHRNCARTERCLSGDRLLLRGLVRMERRRLNLTLKAVKFA